jgi:hypothetical protein
MARNPRVCMLQRRRLEFAAVNATIYFAAHETSTLEHTNVLRYGGE